MQEKSDSKNGSSKPVKRKHVGDETPNPLPDGAKIPSDGDGDEKGSSST